MDIRATARSIERPQLYTARHYSFADVDGLSRRALNLHLELYRGYVNQVNALQAPLDELVARARLNDSQRLQKDGLVRRLAFEVNGMRLHEMFFEQLDGRPSSPTPSPSSVLMEAMDTSFQGLDGWRNDINQLAETRGVGWVISARHADTNRFSNFWIGEHHLGTPAGLQPIAVFDLWEHAWLLDFAPGARSDYLSVLFRNLDWSVLERRCSCASTHPATRVQP